MILHQICFNLNDGDELGISVDPVAGITANIDSINTQTPIAEVVNFDPIVLSNEDCDCFKLTAQSGAASQALNCLTPIDPLEFVISNCDEANVVGLAPGLSHVLINGVINIEGAPTQSGTFTYFIIPGAACDCDIKAGTFTVDNSKVMIGNVCYDNISDAISDYQNGELIEIVKDLETPAGPLSLGNINIRLRKNIKWTKK